MPDDITSYASMGLRLWAVVKSPHWHRPNYVQWLGWEPRDVWVGVFWDRGWVPGEIARRRTQVYVCLVPCFPIRLTWVES